MAPAEAERRGFALEIGGAENLRLQIVERPLRGEETALAIHPHAAGEIHVARFRVVLAVVAVDCRVLVADDHVVLRDRQPVFHPGGLRGDLDRDVAEAAKLRLSSPEAEAGESE